MVDGVPTMIYPGIATPDSRMQVRSWHCSPGGRANERARGAHRAVWLYVVEYLSDRGGSGVHAPL